MQSNVVAERDAWIRSWNRLEAAISHHKKGKNAMFVDEVDEALYAARDRILKERAVGCRTCVGYGASQGCPECDKYKDAA